MIVYNRKTGLGGKVITEIGMDWYKVEWFDGTTEIVDFTALETNWFKKAYNYTQNIPLRIENWYIANAGEILGVIIFLLATALFLFTFTKCVL